MKNVVELSVLDVRESFGQRPGSNAPRWKPAPHRPNAAPSLRQPVLTVVSRYGFSTRYEKMYCFGNVTKSHGSSLGRFYFVGSFTQHNLPFSISSGDKFYSGENTENTQSFY